MKVYETVAQTNLYRLRTAIRRRQIDNAQRMVSDLITKTTWD